MHGQVGPIPSPNVSGIEKGSRQDEKHGAMPTCDDHRREILVSHIGKKVNAICTHDAIVSPSHARAHPRDSIELGNGDEHRRHSTKHTHG